MCEGLGSVPRTSVCGASRPDYYTLNDIVTQTFGPVVPEVGTPLDFLVTSQQFSSV